MFSDSADAFRYRRGKNRDFCKFLVSQGIKIDPKNTLTALSTIESPAVDIDRVESILNDLEINDNDETRELFDRAYHNYYRTDLDQYEF